MSTHEKCFNYILDLYVTYAYVIIRHDQSHSLCLYMFLDVSGMVDASCSRDEIRDMRRISYVALMIIMFLESTKNGSIYVDGADEL